MEMSVSPIIKKKGKPYVYVQFKDGVRMAEGQLPDGKIFSQKGFTPEEVEQLAQYLVSEKESIMQTAKGIHVMDAFLKG